MIGRVNTGGGGTGGTLTVTAPANVTVTVSKDGKTKTKNSGISGVVVFKGLTTGTWTVAINDGTTTFNKTVVITTDYSVAISFSRIPEFTYTGDSEIVNDSDEPITVSQVWLSAGHHSALASTPNRTCSRPAYPSTRQVVLS